MVKFKTTIEREGKETTVIGVCQYIERLKSGFIMAYFMPDNAGVKIDVNRNKTRVIGPGYDVTLDDAWLSREVYEMIERVCKVIEKEMQWQV